MAAEHPAQEPVRFWDYRDDYFDRRRAILERVDAVFASGRLILGSRVAAFEERFSAWCGARHGIGVNSGTDALFLALKALGIGAGDEVLTVANTAVPTVAAIRAAGAIPRFVDVEESTMLMDAQAVEEQLSPRSRVLLPVHLYGQAVEMAPLLELAGRHGLVILEDCAQAAGASYRGQRVGSFGAIGAFSFYPTKVLGGFGDGGMAVTSDEVLHEKLRRLRFYGMQGGYYAEEEGYNSRLDEVQAALLDLQLDGFADAVARRRRIAALYDDGLAGIDELVTPVIGRDRDHLYYLYTIRTVQRDRLQAHLAELGIETRINYPTPVHLMRGYACLGYCRGDLPVTERLAGEILSLPLYPALAQSSVLRVVAAIRAFFGA